MRGVRWREGVGEVAEYGLLMSGGGVHIRCDDPEVERIYPTRQWAGNEIRTGGHVYRRRIILIEDRVELAAEDAASIPEMAAVQAGEG